jgi:hypothetical protein
MPSAGFEPAIPATKRPKTYALDRIGITNINTFPLEYINALKLSSFW